MMGVVTQWSGTQKVSLTVDRPRATTSDFDYLVCFRRVICHRARHHLWWAASAAKAALANAGGGGALLKPPAHQLQLSVQQRKGFSPPRSQQANTSCCLFQSNGRDGPTGAAGVRRDGGQHEGVSNATSEKTSFSSPTNGMTYKKA